jgi:hypothetical protein
MQGEAVLGKPFAEHVQHPAGIVFVVDGDDHVVRVPHHECLGPKSRLHFPREPRIQDLVQIDVREER